MGSTVRTGRFGRSSDELEEMRELVRLADLDAQENWDDPQWRHQMLSDLVEIIWTGFQHENLVELLSTVEYAEETERITIEEATGLEVFWVAAGGQIDQSVIDEHVWELARNYVGYHVAEFEEKIRNGYSKYQGNLVPLCIQQMDAAVNSRLLRTFQAAIPLSGSPSLISRAGFLLSDLNTALTEVSDEASGWPGEYNEAAIVGRQTMVDEILNQLQSNDNFAPATQDEIIRTGVMGTYRGAKIIKLRNWKDRAKRPFFPGNELLVVSTAASKVGFWGGLKSKEWTEEGGEYWHNWGKRQAGFAVHHPEFARRIVDTAKAA